MCSPTMSSMSTTVGTTTCTSLLNGGRPFSGNMPASKSNANGHIYRPPKQAASFIANYSLECETKRNDIFSRGVVYVRSRWTIKKKINPRKGKKNLK